MISPYGMGKCVGEWAEMHVGGAVGHLEYRYVCMGGRRGGGASALGVICHLSYVLCHVLCHVLFQVPCLVPYQPRSCVDCELCGVSWCSAVVVCEI